MKQNAVGTVLLHYLLHYLIHIIHQHRDISTQCCRPTTNFSQDYPVLGKTYLKALEKVITRTLGRTTEETRTISVSTENAVDVELELGYESEDNQNAASLELAFSYAWAKEKGSAETKSRTSSVAVTCDVLPEHRMYAYVTADTYRTRVPWKGRMTKIFWDGSFTEEEVAGTNLIHSSPLKQCPGKRLLYEIFYERGFYATTRF